MESDWPKAIDFVLRMEAGENYATDPTGCYSNDPKDSGGETKWGISKKAFPDLDIKNLTLDQAKTIYINEYWNEVHGDELPWAFAVACMDMAVNEGCNEARRMLQVALGVNVDGNIGSDTVKAAFSAGVHEIKKFLAERLVAYTRLCMAKPNDFVWDYDWSFRVISLTKLIFMGTDK